jgi:hypothetical protein
MVHLLSKPIIEERDELSKRKRGNKNGKKEIEKEPISDRKRLFFRNRIYGCSHHPSR